jgi:hypothetical protein
MFNTDITKSKVTILKEFLSSVLISVLFLHSSVAICFYMASDERSLICETSGSHGSKYKDDSFLGYSAM